MFHSIRVRLTLWYLLILGLLLFGFAAFTYVLLSRNLYDRLDAALLQSARNMANTFLVETREEAGNPQKGAQESLLEVSLPGTFTAIFADNSLLASNFPSGWSPGSAQKLLLRSKTSAESSFATTDEFDVESVRLSGLTVESGGQPFLVILGQPLRPIVEQMAAIRQIYYVVLPIALLLAGLGGSWLAGKSLRPVLVISDQARHIGATNLHERLRVRNRNDELGSLAEVFNELLARLERSFVKMKEFTADVSHEIRTPLAIIRGESEVALSRERSSQEYKESLRIIQEETLGLNQIIDDLLALARADSGRTSPIKQEFYLNDLVEQSCKGIQKLAASKAIMVDCTPSEDISFFGDEKMLGRMIFNLLENAVKYTGLGGEVGVRLENGGSSARIIISDTGIGIPPEAVHRVFDRFYRVDKARNRDVGGSGLGLPIAKWAAESHLGTVKLESVVGRGSVFTVSLPLGTPSTEA